ncbi:MAG: response regulator [Alphaproteobacteria bacterium]|nr:response regulator [Alphaproteobacteria bacterium]
MEDPRHILVVDDDRRLRELLHRYLSDNGFLVTSASDATDARRLQKGMVFDLIVLDVMMPGESGLELARALRQMRNNVPILMLTAMGEPSDRIGGLEAGADDYLPKPFEPRELLLRIRTILKRAMAGAPQTEPAPEIRLGPLRFDRDRAILLDRDGGVVRVTTAEASLLNVLSEAPGEVLSRQSLGDRCAIGGGDRAVDVQVARLRRKIETDPKNPRYLQTVRGRGYVLRPD